LVWRTQVRPRDLRRGLIGYGVVGGALRVVADPDPGWADEARSLPAPRVEVALRPLERPVWLEDAPEVLGALAANGRRATIVAEDADAWNAAARLAGISPHSPRSGDAYLGQGWRMDAQQRQVIEDAAMRAAKAYYRQCGYTVEDVHLEESYDLRCTRGTDELHVEVKGTTSAVEYVLLTAGEVRQARACDHAVLFVVGNLRLRLEGDEPVVTGGDPPTIIDPWLPAEPDLTALRYQYRVPAP
jgi:Domain of unknown function (DUF3883)